jgi:AraC-like DNA-binding protein
VIGTTSPPRRLRIGDVRVHRVHATTDRVPLVSPLDAAGLLWAFFVTEGAILVGSDGPTKKVVAGEGIFVVDGEGVTATALEATRVLGVAMPQELFTDVRVPDAHLVVIKRDSALVAPVTSFLNQVDEADDATSTQGRFVLERLVQGMLIGVLIENLGATRAGLPDIGIFERATFFIETRHDLGDLSSRVVAEHVRLSVRQLERLFSANGTTVGREIRRVKVWYAIELLRDEQRSGLSVDQIATFAGFSSGSSLARAFANEGLPAPGSYRRTV